MNIKILPLIVLTLVVILSACSPPTPVGEIASPSSGYQPLTVEQVEVEVGVASPIPVQVIASGNLPDTCAQIEYTEIKQNESNFQITLSTVPSNSADCMPARDTLPFEIMIPLNIVELPAGGYSVEVNGLPANFKVETDNTASSLPNSDFTVTKDEIQVDGVNVQVGVGSPIPVRAEVSLSLPNTCAQLSEIRLHRDRSTFYVQLIAGTAERSGCKEDLIPFRLEIPLNIINLPAGPYEVNINGVTASFDPNVRAAGDSDSSTSVAEPPCLAPVDVSAADGQISYNGISFHLDPAIAGLVSARACPKYLPDEQDMENPAHPAYTEFYFPAFNRRHIDFRPEIRVYEVIGDLQNYPFPLNVLDDLRETLEQRTEPISWFQHSPLHAHQAYLEFADGAGVRGMLQYMQDYFFFTNNGLIYEFHGLTQDGRYFVSVRYPVSVPFLMELNGFSLPPDNLNPQAIAIPAWPADFEGQRQVIEEYNTEALQLFEQMSDGDVLPDLALLDKLVQSIQIGQP